MRCVWVCMCVCICRYVNTIKFSCALALLLFLCAVCVVYVFILFLSTLFNVKKLFCNFKRLLLLSICDSSFKMFSYVPIFLGYKNLDQLQTLAQTFVCPMFKTFEAVLHLEKINEKTLTITTQKN